LLKALVALKDISIIWPSEVAEKK